MSRPPLWTLILTEENVNKVGVRACVNGGCWGRERGGLGLELS